MESSHEKRKVGRPRFLTDSAKKRIARERNRAAVFRTKVYLGDQYQRWMLKKEELGETHADLPRYCSTGLLDYYFYFFTNLMLGLIN